MQLAGRRRIDVVAALAVVALALQGAGVAPLGQVAGVALAALAGHRAGTFLLEGGDVGALARGTARRLAPALVLCTLLAALWARLSPGAPGLGEVRGALTWTWLGFGDVHAVVRSASSWQLDAPVDPTLGLWVVAGAARPALLLVAICSIVRADPARARLVALVGLALAAVAALVWLPGAEGARLAFAPEATTAAAMVGALAALSAVPRPGWRPPVLGHRLPIDGDLAVLAALLCLGPVLDLLEGELEGAALAVGGLVIVLLPAVCVALVAEAVDRSAASDDLLAAVLPPLALVSVLVLWQATGSFHTEPPVQVRPREVESVGLRPLGSAPYVEANLEEAGQRPPQEGQPRHEAQRGTLIALAH